jgi:hypothetical protein
MKKTGPPVPNRRFPGYENVYMDNDTNSGIVKPIVTSPAKSSEDLKVAKVKLLRQNSSGNERQANTNKQDIIDKATKEMSKFMIESGFINKAMSHGFKEPDDVTFQKINRIQENDFIFFYFRIAFFNPLIILFLSMFDSNN